MIIVYPGDAKDLLGTENYARALAFLPGSLQQRIAAYRLPEDRAVRLAGKLLLREIMENAGLDAEELLLRLRYAPNGKPFIPGLQQSFNIAHTGIQAFVVWSDETSVGIDAEQIKPLLTDDFRDYFQETEWAVIEAAPNRAQTFYHLWTRKEAVIKAIGAGISYPLKALNVLQDEVVANGQNWHLHTINYRDNYCVHVATNAGDVSCHLLAEELFS